MKVAGQANYSNASRTDEPASALARVVSICQPAEALLFIRFKMIHPAIKMCYASDIIGHSILPLLASDREAPREGVVSRVANR